MSEKVPHLEAWTYSLKLGATGFGGPLALMLQMQKDLVEKKKWVSKDLFLRVLPMLKSMPGPVAYQTLLFLVRHRLPKWSAAICGILFILPAFLMMVAFGQLESQLDIFGTWQAKSIFEGLQAAALGVIFFALKDFTQSFWIQPRYWAYTVASLIIMGLTGVSEVLVLLGAGSLAIVGGKMRERRLWSFPWELLWVAFQAGAFSFGTGLTIVPILQSDFVDHFHWVTQKEFLEALALGQLTPGPVTISLSLLGFKVAGWAGAILCTFFVFLPGTIHQLTWFPRWVHWMGEKSGVKDFLLGAMAALSAGMILALVDLSSQLTALQFLCLFLFVAVKPFFKPAVGLLVLATGLFSGLVSWMF